VHQIVHVLRMRPGDECLLLDGSGRAYRAVLQTLDSRQATARVVERLDLDTEPRTRLWLHQALLVERKMDWVLQKGTELGVGVFAPVASERSLPGRVDAARLARWRRIVTEAAEQSHRARLPELYPPTSLADACAAVDGALALMAVPSEDARPLRVALEGAHATPPHGVHVFIGPEGGFSAREIDTALRAGVLPVSLGPRVLRTETAGLAALVAILYALGEMG